MAFRVPERRDDFLAKGKDDLPIILISTPGAGEKIPPRINLELITIDHALNCEITVKDGEKKKGLFSIIRCVSKDRKEQELFLRLIYPIVKNLPNRPTYQDLNGAINSILALFKRLTQPAKKTVQGLWAELLLIAKSKNPLKSIEGWHMNPGDIYDFSFGDLRIEVKSSTEGVRIHHFSFEQLHPPSGTRAIIVSVLVEEKMDGYGIYELVDIIEARIRNNREATDKMNIVIADVLGDRWKKATELKFDMGYAYSTTKYYESSSVPTVLGPVPVGVSQVKYISDLSYSEPLSADELFGNERLIDILPER